RPRLDRWICASSLRSVWLIPSSRRTCRMRSPTARVIGECSGSCIPLSWQAHSVPTTGIRAQSLHTLGAQDRSAHATFASGGYRSATRRMGLCTKKNLATAQPVDNCPKTPRIREKLSSKCSQFSHFRGVELHVCNYSMLWLRLIWFTICSVFGEKHRNGVAKKSPHITSHF